jgi:hypothetical protein
MMKLKIIFSVFFDILKTYVCFIKRQKQQNTDWQKNKVKNLPETCKKVIRINTKYKKGRFHQTLFAKQKDAMCTAFGKKTAFQFHQHSVGSFYARRS